MITRHCQLIQCFFSAFTVFAVVLAQPQTRVHGHLQYQARNDSQVEAVTLLPKRNEKYCPGEGPGGATSEQKTNEIQLGLIGSRVDPVLLALTREESHVFDFSGYSPPAPEYLIAILHRMTEINNSSSLLPFHKLCIVSSLNTSIEKNLNVSFDLVRGEVLATIDALANDISLFALNVLLPFSVPTIQVADLRGISSINPLPAHIFGKPSRSRFGGNFLFTMTPDPRMVYRAIKEFAAILGWRRLGILYEYSASQDLIMHRLRCSMGDLEVILSRYNDTDPLQSFRPFIENEVQIYAFHGDARTYLQVMKFAAEYHFTGPGYVWICPYFSIVFPDNYRNLWHNFTREEVFIIKNALKGSLSIGVVEGFGEEYQDFLENFVGIAGRITNQEQVYSNRRRLPQTAYAHDSITVLAHALDELVHQKASDANTSLSTVNVTHEDRAALAELIANGTADGLTGTVAFRNDGKRDNAIYSIRNFVGVDNNFHLNNSLDVDPWVVQIRACIFIESKTARIQYVDSNGNASEDITIVFADGTNTVPRDRPYRFFVRTTTRILIGTVCSTILFALGVVTYITVIAYLDRRALLYNDDWIYKEENIDNGLLDQGIRGRLGTTQSRKAAYAIKLVGSGKLSTGRRGIGRLRMDGAIVYIKKVDFDGCVLTPKLRLEVNTLRELEHPNVCAFVGCILDVSTTALLYEFCSRGSLKDVLYNSSIELDWLFRLSFAIDAAKGMAYLHSKKIVHGHLKSKICVIDEHWTLKITDYGLDELRRNTWRLKPKHSITNLRKRKASVAPEIRLLGASFSQASDIYSYGSILEELAISMSGSGGTHAVLGKGSLRSISNYEEHIPPKFLQLISKCQDTRPQARPGFETITVQLKHLSPHMSGNDHGIMQLYSRRLEEHLEETTHNLYSEKERYTELMYNIIPRSVVDSMQEGKTAPIQQYANAAILCVEVMNMEQVLQSMDPHSKVKTVSAIQKTMEGVTLTADVQRMQYSGSMWIFTSGVYGSELNDPVIEATSAAIRIIEAFKCIILPLLSEVAPAVRIGLHAGPILCGVLDQPVPQHVILGTTVQSAMQLMIASKAMMILASWEVAHVLQSYTAFQVTFKGNIKISEGKETSVFSIEEQPREASLQPSRRTTVSSMTSIFRSPLQKERRSSTKLLIPYNSQYSSPSRHNHRPSEPGPRASSASMQQSASQACSPSTPALSYRSRLYSLPTNYLNTNPSIIVTSHSMEIDSSTTTTPVPVENPPSSVSSPWKPCHHHGKMGSTSHLVAQLLALQTHTENSPPEHNARLTHNI